MNISMVARVDAMRISFVLCLHNFFNKIYMTNNKFLHFALPHKKKK